QARQYEFQRGYVVNEGLAQIAAYRVRDKGDVLPPQGLIETQCAHGGFDVALVGLRADEDLDRVADGVDADEQQQRHDEEHQQRLQPASREKTDHGVVSGCTSKAKLYSSVRAT